MNPFLRFFIRFLKIFIRSLFRAAVPTEHHCTQNGSTPPEQVCQSITATSEPAPTETAPTETTTAEPTRKRRHRRTSVTETTTRTTTISESQSSPELANK